MCPTGKMSINDLSKQGYLMFAVSPVLNLSEQGCELSASSSRSQGFFLNLQRKSPENEVACYLLRNMKGCDKEAQDNWKNGLLRNNMIFRNLSPFLNSACQMLLSSYISFLSLPVYTPPPNNHTYVVNNNENTSTLTR